MNSITHLIPQFRTFVFTVLVLSLMPLDVFAQDEAPVINVDNILQLQSVEQIDFADFEGEFSSGWFAMDTNANKVAFINTDNCITAHNWLLNTGYDFCLGDANSDETLFFIDAIWNRDNEFFSLYQINEQIYVNSQLIAENEIPLSISDAVDNGFILVELLDSGTGLSKFLEFEITPLTMVLNMTDIVSPAYQQDEEAVVRIGRIEPSYVVTSSLDGIVKLWELQINFVLAEVDNGIGEPSTFGAINADATHFAWRDNLSSNLYLMDFATGENLLVTELAGGYAQYFFLSADADVVIAVNLDFIPNVYVFDVATGERHDLGTYRECNRVPDMVRLSRDGTTLVIGCDTGLEIWRIAD